MKRSIALLCILLVACVAVVPAASFAQEPAPAAAAPGFPAALPAGNTVDRQSPVVAEIVATSPGKEVATATAEGQLVVYSSGGGLLWQQQIPPTLCATVNGGTRVQNAPAVGDLEGDGTPDLVVGYGTTRTNDGCPGGVAAFDGRGTLKWRYQIQRTSREPLNGVYSTPALADVDGSGKLKVAFGSFDRHFYLLEFTGNLIWRFHTADTVWSSPAFADLDGDRRLDLVFGADIGANSTFKTINGGFVYAFKTLPVAGLSNNTIPFEPDPARLTKYGLLWRTINYDQVIYSSPAVADLEGDGSLEVVVASGCFYPRSSSNPTGKWVKILNAANGAEERTLALPVATCSRSSPALGDLDGDGRLDIALNISGETSYGGNGACNVAAWRADGTLLWNVTAPAGFGFGGDPGCDNLQSPVVADMDGNGSPEVLTVSAWGIAALAGANGALLSGATQPVMGFGQNLSHATPAVGDLDGDGTLEIVAGAQGALYAFGGLAGVLQSPPAAGKAAYNAPWPMFRGGAARTGVVPPQPSVRVSASGLDLLIEAGQERALSIGLSNTADGALGWSVEGVSGSWLSASPQSGTTPGTLTLTIKPGGLQPGNYDGSVTLSAASSFSTPAVSLPAASFVLPVRLRVAEQTFAAQLPLVVK